MVIRESTEHDRNAILTVHTQAFGETKGPEIAELVDGLFDDATALPMLSLIAEKDNTIVGHVLFTKATLTGAEKPVTVQLLAPLAILPDHQRTGVGGQLIAEGLQRLKASGVDLVFVLGHPDYYPRSGFTPAGVHGFDAPYPIPEMYAGAWMVQELHDGAIGSVSGTVQCSEVLDQPQHWRE